MKMFGQERFIEVFGLELYSKFIIQNSDVPFEEAVTGRLYSGITMKYNGHKNKDNGIARMKIGKVQIYFCVTPDLIELPENAKIKTVACNVDKFRGFPNNAVEEIKDYIKSGTTNKQRILRRRFDDLRYIEKAIAGKKMFGPGSKYCSRKLADYGFVQENDGIWYCM